MGHWNHLKQVLTVFCICSWQVLTEAAIKASNPPAFRHWEENSPTVNIPNHFRGSVSPLRRSVEEKRFISTVTRGAIFPPSTASFCRAAGFICVEDVNITPYNSEPVGTLNVVPLARGSPGRTMGIKTINDFQFDFFLEENLAKGASMNLAENLHDPIPKRSFLPKAVADTLTPVTTSNLPKLRQTFNIGENTKMATIMGTAAYLCENPPLPGEERACPASVESMAKFVSSQLGRNATMLKTRGAPGNAPAQKKPLIVKDFTKHSVEEGKKIVVCHNLMFPSQLYYCHHVTGTKVVEASLAAADGYIIRGVAVCHLNTTMWGSEHPAFAALKIPRGAEACHWTSQNDLIWVPVQQ